MFGIGTFELFLILIFGFLIFGPDKLPAIAKIVGQAINKFRNAQDEMNKVLKTEVYDPSSDEPFKNPLDAIAKVTGANKKEQTESFSTRKDRYDKQREAKRKAEERKKAAATTVAAGTVAEKAITDESKAEKEAEPKTTKPMPSADELYGNKPASIKVKSDNKPADQQMAKPAEPADKLANKAEPKPATKPDTEPEEKSSSTSSEKKGE